jgi:hypothetical protein
LWQISKLRSFLISLIILQQQVIYVQLKIQTDFMTMTLRKCWICSLFLSYVIFWASLRFAIMDITLRTFSPHSDSIDAASTLLVRPIVENCYDIIMLRMYCIVHICLHYTLYSSYFFLDKISISQNVAVFIWRLGTEHARIKV